MKVYLIGYMGSGKTTIGKIIAEKMQWKFVDMDSVIETKYGMEVAEIFRTYGEQEFRGAEQDLLKELAEEENAVISTGGGVPCFFDNMAQMNRNGKTFYIKFSPEKLAQRLLETNISKRPVLQAAGDNLEKFIAETLSEREVFYEQASDKVTGTDENIVESILYKLKHR
ncbi:MAG: shikimate kinase [Paludibacteraceae bacterium]